MLVFVFIVITIAYVVFGVVKPKALEKALKIKNEALEIRKTTLRDQKIKNPENSDNNSTSQIPMKCYYCGAPVKSGKNSCNYCGMSWVWK